MHDAENVYDYGNNNKNNSIHKLQDSVMNKTVKPSLVIMPMSLGNCVEAFVCATQTLLKSHKTELDDQIYVS